MTARFGATVLSTAVDLHESTDTRVGTKVDVTGHSSTADVEPVGTVRGELLVSACLHDVDPLRHLQLWGFMSAFARLREVQSKTRRTRRAAV